MDVVVGDGQASWVGNPLPDSLTVRILDEGGAPLEDVSVSWEVEGGAGSVSPRITPTDASGEARTTWILGDEEGQGMVRAVVVGLPPVTFTATARIPAGRVFEDRPDDATGPQIHVLYVVPGGGTDRALDVDGVLARSVASFHAWFRAHTRLSIRFDTHDGALDVTFVRLVGTDQAIAETGAGVLHEIASELEASGRLQPEKNYLVYYDGHSTYACGGAAWPPRLPGRVAAMYLQGEPDGGHCPLDFVASADGFPGYWEFAALHDLLHTFGVVSPAAPHHTEAYPGHVPEPNDLMYSGPGPWVLDATTTVDVGGDDYFGPSVPVGVTRLDASLFVIADSAPSASIRRP